MTKKEPKIRSYVPLNGDFEKSGESLNSQDDQKPKIELDQKAELTEKEESDFPEMSSKPKPKDPDDPTFSLEEERAFAVGLVTIICVVCLIILIVVWRQITSHKQPAGEVKPAKDEATEEMPVLENQPSSSETQESPSAATETPAGSTYSVESGDTLYSIGQKLDVDWHQIADINNLQPPYTLRSGQELSIP